MLLLSMGDCMIEMSSEIHPAHMNLDWLLGLDLPVCFFKMVKQHVPQVTDAAALKAYFHVNKQKMEAATFLIIAFVLM